jgi:hypothetical protein
MNRLLLLALASAIPVFALAGEPVKGPVMVAVLPMQNDARIKPRELEYLNDVVRGGFLSRNEDEFELVDLDAVAAAVQENEAGKSACDHTCAAEIGRSFHAEFVVTVQVLRLGKSYRTALKLVDVQAAAVISVERALGDDLGEMEKALPDAIQALLRAVFSEREASTPPPRAPGSYYAALSVTAMGIRPTDPEYAPSPISAKVYINGALVGTTPYEDGLPAGRYRVKIEYNSEAPKIADIDVEAGRSYSVDSEFPVPLTREENEARREALWAAQQAERKEALAEWKRRHEAWTVEADAIRPKRRRRLIPGSVLTASGAGAVVAGSALMILASSAQEDIDRYYNTWLQSTDPETIDAYATKVRDREDSRDAKRTAGIALLGAGGAAAIAGIVLMSLSPRLPEAPRPPADADKLELTGVMVLPSVNGRRAFAALGFSF